MWHSNKLLRREVYFENFVDILKSCFLTKEINQEMLRRETELQYLKESDFIWSQELRQKLMAEIAAFREILKQPLGEDRHLV